MRASSLGRRATAVRACCALAALSISGIATAAEDRPAILIRRGALLTPSEIAGAELSPEVSVRLQVDERGRVVGTEVLGVEPSSEFDGLLRESVGRQLAGWRFAPAIEAGAPVASTIELLVQVRAFPQSPKAVEDEVQDLFLSGDSQRRSADLMRSSFDRRREVLQRLSTVAEKHLDQEHRRQAASARFVVVTDARDERVAEVLAANLDAAYGQFLELFAQIEPYPERYQMLAYLFSSRSAFLGTSLELRLPSTADGLYAAPGLLAFHQEVRDSSELLARMVHEAFHAFSDRALRRPGRFPLPWLEEGLATYLGNSQIKQGRLVPGKTLQRKFVMHYGRVWKVRTRAALSVDEIRRAVREGTAPGIAELVVMAPQDFYGDRVAVHYATSWLLIHFLRHGEPAWSEERFPQFLLYVYEGYPAIAALEHVYGGSVAELDAAFRRYAKSF